LAARRAYLVVLVTSFSINQGDAKWIVIRQPLRGHNDTPFGRPNPGRPIGCPEVGRSKGVFGGSSY